MEKKYQIEHPIAAEITIGGEGRDISEFCLEGLKLAVKEKGMTPETASEYYKSWFNVEVNFNEE